MLIGDCGTSSRSCGIGWEGAKIDRNRVENGIWRGTQTMLLHICSYCKIQDHISIFALGIIMPGSEIITKVKIIIIIIAIYCQEERHFPFMPSRPLVSILAAMFCRGSSSEKCTAALF